MSFVFDEKKATNSLGETSWATGNRTDYITNFRASFDAMYSSDRFDSEQNSFRKEYSLVVDHLHKKGYTGFDNPFKDNEDVPLGPEDPRAVAEREAMNIVEPSREENIISFWDKVKELPTGDKFSGSGITSSSTGFNTSTLLSSIVPVTKLCFPSESESKIFKLIV